MTHKVTIRTPLGNDAQWDEWWIPGERLPDDLKQVLATAEPWNVFIDIPHDPWEPCATCDVLMQYVE